MVYTYKPAKILPFQGLHGCDSKFGVHAIRLPDGRVAVIATELPDNPGTSVTNFAENLATMSCRLLKIRPRDLIWIEHYPPRRVGSEIRPAQWDLVTFKFDGMSFRMPKWRRMTEDDWHELGLPPWMEGFAS